MKLDTSSYYPKSQLDDLFEDSDNIMNNPENPEQDDSSEPEKKDKDSSPEATHQSGIRYYIDDEEDNATVSYLATAVSWAMVPLMMPVYGILLMFNLSILSLAPIESKWLFTSIIFLITVAIPMISVLILKRMGIVDDLGLNGRKERLIPYIITLVCMIGTTWFLYAKTFPLWAVMFFAGGAIAGLIELIINFRWKISVHAAGIAGIVALLTYLAHDGLPYPGIRIWLVIAILLAGITGSARLWLHRHTLSQVLAGYAVGFFAVYLPMILIQSHS